MLPKGQIGNLSGLESCLEIFYVDYTPRVVAYFLCVSAKVREINLFWHSNAPLSPFDMTHTSYPVSPSHFLFYFRVSLDHSPDPHTGSCLVTHPLPITSHTTPELTTWFQHLTSSCLQQLKKNIGKSLIFMFVLLPWKLARVGDRTENTSCMLQVDRLICQLLGPLLHFVLRCYMQAAAFHP